MSVVYNEIDPFAAEWLRALVRGGHIADGGVDERSVVDLRAVDVAGATQFHAFAGIGVWSYALRLAGWPDDRPVWTGSCPCQPFSSAGKRGGFDDERHLWPAWFRLIRECRPPVIFGEQVASKDGLAWLDAVYADLEAEGYAVGAVDLCAAGVGAPHIRQRLFFVAERVGNAERAGLEGHAGHGDDAGGRALPSGPVAQAGGAVGLADNDDAGCELGGATRVHAYGPCGNDAARCGADGRLADADEGQRGRLADGKGCKFDRAQTGWQQGDSEPQSGGADGRLADAMHTGRPEGWSVAGNGQASGHGRNSRPGPTNGHWRAADWLGCRDGKWRPVEPGTFPLAHGASARVGRLRGYGNAIVAQAAAEVIRAFIAVDAAKILSIQGDT